MDNRGVTLEGIHKQFGGTAALRDICLQVKPGELFGLIGPDGAGKTTLFRIMASLMLPDRGSATVLGLDAVKEYKELRKHIGYMPGRFSLYMDLTVEENLAFYARVFGTTVEAHYDLIRDVYEQIAPFRKRRAGKLSGGMKQKLALSCALIHRPSLLILDEPTTGVDAVSRHEFWEMLDKIRSEGITIVVSTPYMDEAERCDRVGLMNKGRLLSVSSPGDLGRGGNATGQFLFFALRSSDSVYAHLAALRALPGVRHAWLFGDAVHVVVEDAPAARDIEKKLAGRDIPGMRWEAIAPGIEDNFMILLAENSSQFSVLS